MYKLYDFFYFDVSDLFLFNEIYKLYDFFYFGVSNLFFCSMKCLNFMIFSILVSQLNFFVQLSA